MLILIILNIERLRIDGIWLAFFPGGIFWWAVWTLGATTWSTWPFTRWSADCWPGCVDAVSVCRWPRRRWRRRSSPFIRSTLKLWVLLRRLLCYLDRCVGGRVLLVMLTSSNSRICVENLKQSQKIAVCFSGIFRAWLYFTKCLLKYLSRCRTSMKDSPASQRFVPEMIWRPDVNSKRSSNSFKKAALMRISKRT